MELRKSQNVSFVMPVLRIGAIIAANQLEIGEIAHKEAAIASIKNASFTLGMLNWSTIGRMTMPVVKLFR